MNILILVDESEKIHDAAKSIKANLSDMRVSIVDAAKFSAVDLLPADACFIGCEHPHPASFAEAERVLKGINLAGRSCGLFSLASNDAMEYLRGIVRHADLRLNPAPYFADKKAPVGVWIAETLRRS